MDVAFYTFCTASGFGENIPMNEDKSGVFWSSNPSPTVSARFGATGALVAPVGLGSGATISSALSASAFGATAPFFLSC